MSITRPYTFNGARVALLTMSPDIFEAERTALELDLEGVIASVSHT